MLSFAAGRHKGRSLAADTGSAFRSRAVVDHTVEAGSILVADCTFAAAVGSMPVAVVDQDTGNRMEEVAVAVASVAAPVVLPSPGECRNCRRTVLRKRPALRNCYSNIFAA